MSHFTVVRSVALIGALLLSACGGGGGNGDVSSVGEGRNDTGTLSAAPFDGLETFTLPGFPHPIDVYGVSNADRAIVILHGGGGRNYDIARDLGLNNNDGHPSETSIDFARLRAHRILAVFPQGQSLSGNAFTWDNHVMRSGEDDMAFLRKLAEFIRTEYGISKVYLMGHSNGGMMANRFWCESPETFDGYIAIAGPASAYYLSHDCAPEAIQPYYGIVGDQDPALSVDGDWDAPTWTINPRLVASVPEETVVDPTLIGEWALHLRHARTTCETTPTLSQAVRSGNVDTWTSCGGYLKVQRVLAAEHSLESLEALAGFSLFDAATAFIDSLQ